MVSRKSATTPAAVLLQQKRREQTLAEQKVAQRHFGPNEPRTFRRLYLQDELPMRVVYSGRSRRVGWLVDDILALDLQFYLPVFIAAFRESEEALAFLALEASLDVVAVAGANCRAFTLGRLVGGKLKLALRSKFDKAAERGLVFLRAFAGCDASRGAAKGLLVQSLDLDAVAAAVDAAGFQHPRLKDLATAILNEDLPRRRPPSKSRPGRNSRAHDSR